MKFTRLHLILLLTAVCAGSSLGGFALGQKQARKRFTVERSQLLDAMNRQHKADLSKQKAELLELTKNSAMSSVELNKALADMLFSKKGIVPGSEELKKAEIAFADGDFARTAVLAKEANEVLIKSFQKAFKGLYITKNKESLWDVAKEIYGQEIRWMDIFQLNKKKISDYRNLEPGLVLVLPE